MLIPDSIRVWRVAEGDYHIAWQASQADTRVTVEPLTEMAGVSANCQQGEPDSVCFSGLPTSQRCYFQLRDQFGTEVVASDRRLNFLGTPNFRDMGGYQTGSGQSIKWGYLYRSGHLAALQESDVALLSTLELDLVCDFRQLKEQADAPSRLPLQRPPRVLSMPIAPGSNSGFVDKLKNGRSSRQSMFDLMVDINRDFVEQHTTTYGRMFAEILSVENARFLIHCAAGKDRTGFGAALILMALGVPRQAVLADYLLTSQYFEPALEFKHIQKKYQSNLDLDTFMPVLQVDEAYLTAALVAIEQGYQSVDNFLAKALGVGAPELAELRKRYLQ